MRLAKKMGNLGTETAFEVFAKAKKLEAEGKHIIHLEIGEPDFPTPDNISQAAIKSMQAGDTHYTPSNGILHLRESIAKYISKTRGINFIPDEVVITPGGKPIMFYTIIALLMKAMKLFIQIPDFRFMNR